MGLDISMFLEPQTIRDYSKQKVETIEETWDVLVSCQAPITHPGYSLYVDAGIGTRPSIRQANRALYAKEKGIAYYSINGSSRPSNCHPFTWEEWADHINRCRGYDTNFSGSIAKCRETYIKNTKTGYKCERCGEYNEYAAVNQPNGTYICSYHSKY